ncbi:MAG: hypothetical protein KDA65_05810 [Planctomycetaceae bacterium]|nr:hypothetical protein [Planctomycetaceae bacterium]
MSPSFQSIETTMRNPAGRLHAVLEPLSKIDENKSASQVLGSFFEYHENDVQSILRVLFELNIELDKLVNTLSYSDLANKDMYLSNLEPLRKALMPPRGLSQWKNISCYLDSKTIYNLQLIANELGDEGDLENSKLAELKEVFSDLFQTISNEQLPSELKKWILEILSQILLAIDKYQIHGIDGLKRAAAYSIGELIHLKSELLKESNQNWSKPLVETLIKFDITIMGALKRTSAIASGYEAAKKLLGFDSL